MNRRTIGLIVVSLVLGLLVGSIAAAAPSLTKVYRIGVLFPASPSSDSDWQQRSPFRVHFWRGMLELGGIEGQNILVERRKAPLSLASSSNMDISPLRSVRAQDWQRAIERNGFRPRKSRALTISTNTQTDAWCLWCTITSVRPLPPRRSERS